MSIEEFHGGYIRGQILASGIAAATGNLALTLALQDVPGCTFTITTPPQTTTLLVWAVMDAYATNNNTIIGVIDLDGANQAADLIMKADNAAGRNTVSQIYHFSLTGGVAHTVKMEAYQTVAAAGTIYQTHTNLMYLLYNPP